jgi:hypothetical protein
VGSGERGEGRGERGEGIGERGEGRGERERERDHQSILHSLPFSSSCDKTATAIFELSAGGCAEGFLCACQIDLPGCLLTCFRTVGSNVLKGQAVDNEHEVFLSFHKDTIDARLIKGKCSCGKCSSCSSVIGEWSFIEQTLYFFSMPQFRLSCPSAPLLLAAAPHALLDDVCLPSQ